MHLIDGNALAAQLRADLKREIEEADVSPHLKVMLVGDSAPSLTYVTLKKRAAEEIGIRVEIHHLPASTSDQELIKLIQEWNVDPDVHAILVQLPLPERHAEQRVINAIDPDKDVDGFHPANVKALMEDDINIFPPLCAGIIGLIHASGFRTTLSNTLGNRSGLAGAHVTIIANTNVFAEPLAEVLRVQHGTIARWMRPDDITDTFNRTFLGDSDVIITLIGKPDFLKSDLVKDGAVVIDGGYTVRDGRVHGDVDRSSFQDRDVWLSPVPGGVGPMTIACLLANTLKMALAHADRASAA